MAHCRGTSRTKRALIRTDECISGIEKRRQTTLARSFHGQPRLFLYAARKAISAARHRHDIRVLPGALSEQPPQKENVLRKIGERRFLVGPDFVEERMSRNDLSVCFQKQQQHAKEFLWNRAPLCA